FGEGRSRVGGEGGGLLVGGGGFAGFAVTERAAVRVTGAGVAGPALGVAVAGVGFGVALWVAGHQRSGSGSLSQPSNSASKPRGRSWCGQCPAPSRSFQR